MADHLTPEERALIRAEVAAWPALIAGILSLFTLLWVATP